MIISIQVLRIHLLELEKVQELCKDFCNRYITCLKVSRSAIISIDFILSSEQGKMQSENLLRSECGGYESDEGNSHRASQQYFPPHQYNVGQWGTLTADFTVYIITGTVLETDFIPRPGDTISLYFYPFIVSLTNTFLPLVISKNYRK